MPLPTQGSIAIDETIADKLVHTATKTLGASVVQEEFSRLGKDSSILTTAPLVANGVFTQAWQDGELDGAVLVQAAVRADQASAAGGFVIQETDDDADVNFTRTVAAKSVLANTTTFLYALIRSKKWRVQYTNGAAAQLSFKLTATTLQIPAHTMTVDGEALVDILDRSARKVGQVFLRNPGDTATLGDAANPLRVDPTGTTTQPVSDAAGSLTVDTPQLPAALVAGRLDVNVGASVAIDVTDRAARLVGQVEGRAAHGVAVAGNPNLIGGRANQNEPAAVLSGQAVSLWADLLGRIIIVRGHPNPEPPVTVNKTAAASSAVIAAPGANLRLVIRKGSVHNRDAATALVTLLDGATARWVAELAPDGGGSLFDFGDAGWRLTANTALNATLAVAGNVDINITEYSIEAV